ncbi:MAG: alpha-amylase family glycosyl hydrolase [bacterium]
MKQYIHASSNMALWSFWGKLILLMSPIWLLSSCGQNQEASSSANDTHPDRNTADIGQYLSRVPEDEVIYFVLPDRFDNGDPDNDTGGIEGDKFSHGFDPTHKGFYQGGDLGGLTRRLDYIDSLGVTAIWLGPIYKNKPVQGGPDTESAGYHGYWITDFTQVDPHFGTNEELKTFIDEAHKRGIKIYLDIITNHTADVISYRECHDPTYQGDDKSSHGCPYRSKANFPWTRRGGLNGADINKGFMGDSAEFQTIENFSKLTRSDYAYTPFIPAGEENVKVPNWLNNIKYYHNRGETTFTGENSLYGDFAGLDDLMTEHPDVVSGFIEIYKNWISTYHIDGFRIDTARHVNPEFWQQFLPAIITHAHNEGIENFYVFGEVYDPDPGALARFTRVDQFPYLLDFAFQAALYDVLAKGQAPQRLVPLFRADDLYQGGQKTARQLPVFIGNHDMGRFALFVQNENPKATEEEILARVRLGHAFMFYTRGVPVIYYGDEQGFIGDGHDQAARETMFPTQVASYADNNLLGTTATSTENNFNTNHPLYKAISEMAKLYHTNQGLRRGPQIIRLAETTQGGIFAISRLEAETGHEYLIAFNTGTTPRTLPIETDPRSSKWESLYGNCPSKATTTAIITVTIPSLDYIICRAEREE